MIFFRVSENINIKTTDGTLVKYYRNPNAKLEEQYIYCSTFSDYEDLNNVFSRVGKKYQIRTLLEERILNLFSLPLQIGISNQFEHSSIKKFDNRVKNASFISENILKKIKEVSYDEKKFDFKTQINKINKKDISIIIIGGIGEKIGEIVSSTPALRILYNKLKEKFDNVQLDIYLNASDNKYYTRDKELLLSQNYINKVSALSLNLKEFLSYDFYIDNSLLREKTFFNELPYVDAYLYKFGIDYKKISNNKKNISFDNLRSHISSDLIDKIKSLKKTSKLLLYHPYTASEERSIPKECAIKSLNKMIKKLDNYIIISALNISKIEDDRYINLSSYSKNISDFIYIISQADKIITADTSTYHIADAFFIPTVVIFTKDNYIKRCKYFDFTKTVLIKDKSRNFSAFDISNTTLKLDVFKSWNEFKIMKVIKVLETI